MRFAYGTFTLSDGPFQDPSATHRFFDFPGYTLKLPHNPNDISIVGLGSSPFAHRY